MNLQCDMGEAVTGIGYQFYGRTGLLGTRVTTGITSPSAGLYVAVGTPPNGSMGVKWTDGTGDIVAYGTHAPVLEVDDSTPFETARRLIYGHFRDLWEPAPIVPVTYEGQTQKEDEDGWGRLSIAQGEGSEPTTGRRFTRTTGILYLSIFVGRENGTKLFNQCADRFAQIFNRATLREDNVAVKFQVASMADVGARDGYRQKNISCGFTRDCYPSS